MRWGTDEEGHLVAVDTREARRAAAAVFPPGAGPGQTVEVEAGGRRVRTTIPAGVGPGDVFEVGGADPEAGAGLVAGEDGAPVTAEDVADRLRRLQTPLSVQVWACRLATG